jgi:hypothetical protein
MFFISWAKGLIRQLLLHDNSSVAVGGFLLARSLARRWRRAILGDLLTFPTDALRELLHLVADNGTVAGVGMDRA